LELQAASLEQAVQTLEMHIAVEVLGQWESCLHCTHWPLLQ